MFMLGMAANWTEQFDCNRFATIKVAVMHVRYLVDTWLDRKPASAPAVGEFYYNIGGVEGRGHAIIVTIENGKKTYRDVYSSKELTLTTEEEASVLYIKF
jgi:hypothetical protein